jgi:hypothetical protein
VPIVPTVEFPPGTPFTLQLTAVFVELLTVAVNVCGSPSNIATEVGARLTVTFEGGGCGGAEPTKPPQPRKDAAKNTTGHKMFVKLRRPPYAVPLSMHQRIARAVPRRGIHKNHRCANDSTCLRGESTADKSYVLGALDGIALRCTARNTTRCKFNERGRCIQSDIKSGRFSSSIVSNWGSAPTCVREGFGD